MARNRRGMKAADYRMLAGFRQRIREYLHFSERAARGAGLEAQQYQLLLALKGLPRGTKPTIRELATRLLIEHHSAVGLVDRLAHNGLVERQGDTEDRRQIKVVMTARGEKLIARLALYHAEELSRVAPGLIEALANVISAASGDEQGKPSEQPMSAPATDVQFGQEVESAPDPSSGD